jgi:heat shock protein HslJ
MRAFALALLLAAGCTYTGVYPRAIAGHIWRAETIASNPLLADTRITLALDRDGRAWGTTGCNDYYAVFRVIGPERISFDRMSSTRRGCASAVMAQENAYLMLLQDVDRYRWSRDGPLELSDSDGRTIVLRRPL